MAQRVQLWMGGGFDAVWALARPWFDDAAKRALLARAPWVVLTPTRAAAHALKARLLAGNRSLGGVYFWTPGDLRDHLRRLQRDTPHIAVREHLHLLLASADTGHEAPREPARLMRALDQLCAAGCMPDALDFPPAETLARTLAADLERANWTTVQALDWALARHPPEGALERLLVLGFDAAHWELWPLLLAGVCSAYHASVLLTPPRTKAEELDQIWIGSWEHILGDAEPVPGAGATAAPFQPLAQRMENPEGATGSTPDTRPVVHIGRTLRDQAEAIVAQALAYACEQAADRIGLVFPGPGPLAREVSALLLQRGVPHFDTFGHSLPPTAAAERWRAWITLQRQPLVESIQRLLALDPDAAPPDELEDELSRAQADVLVDDLAVLSQRMRDSGRPGALAAADFLARYAPLPAKGSVRELADATRAQWQALRWDDVIPALDEQVRSLAPLAARPLSLSHWLDWLASITPRPPPARAPDAANPLARIHLVSYAQAEGLPWSHLILTDLNEGRWPPPPETSGFLSEDRIAALNRDAIEQGRHGEGHLAVKTGRSLLLGGYERRELQRRQFYNLVETPAAGLALTCALEGEDGGGRIAPASDFLSHLYFCAHGEPLTESRMQEIAAHTRAWLERWPAPPALDPPRQPEPPARAAEAHRTRRAVAAFGPYECAFTAAPPQPAHLSCKAWEQAVCDPAARWMSLYLGVQPASDFGADDPWPVTRGTWVHRWLAAALCDVRGRFETRQTGAALLDRVRRQAAATHRAIAHAFSACGRGEPQWWRARVAQAEWMALQFAQRLAELREWPSAAVEWTLPRAAAARLDGGALALRGRIDVLFAGESPGEIPRAGWIVDFKTGQDKPLSDRKLARALRSGNGVQICLYALALADAGAQDVQVSLLTAEDEVKPQVGLDAIRAQAPVWSALLRMQETGIFGIRGVMRAEYGRSLELPLATLPVEPDVLEEKWALTHPGLADVEATDGEG